MYLICDYSLANASNMHLLNTYVCTNVCVYVRKKCVLTAKKCIRTAVKRSLDLKLIFEIKYFQWCFQHFKILSFQSQAEKKQKFCALMSIRYVRKNGGDEGKGTARTDGI